MPCKGKMKLSKCELEVNDMKIKHEAQESSKIKNHQEAKCRYFDALDQEMIEQVHHTY